MEHRTTVAVSGGFDPLHPGHIKYIEEAKALGGRLIVILTRDDQLREKDRKLGHPKKREPIPFDVRRAVIEWGLRDRGIVVPNIDKDITSRSSIAQYHGQYGIDVFAKGGDTWDADNLPEKEVCDRLGIQIVFGVGGYDKQYESSKM
jgi:D-beta-D-heptose 7-phosphate kinase/D-beta-D-heptose 1-phosphate adenosyltransferase